MAPVYPRSEVTFDAILTYPGQFYTVLPIQKIKGLEHVRWVARVIFLMSICFWKESQGRKSEKKSNFNALLRVEAHCFFMRWIKTWETKEEKKITYMVYYYA